MKQIILFLLFLLSMPALGLAQYSIALQGGMNLTDAMYCLPHGERIGTSPRLGYFAGLSVRRQVRPKWATQLDLNYSQRMYQYGLSPISSRLLGTENRRRYVDMTARVTHEIAHNLEIGLGIYVAQELQEQQRIETFSEWTDTGELDLSANTDFGLSPSLIFHWGRFRAFFNYQIGLRNLIALEYTDETGTISTPHRTDRHSTLQIGLSYAIFD
jgi:hypothetical protein